MQRGKLSPPAASSISCSCCVCSSSSRSSASAASSFFFLPGFLPRRVPGFVFTCAQQLVALLLSVQLLSHAKYFWDFGVLVSRQKNDDTLGIMGLGARVQTPTQGFRQTLLPMTTTVMSYCCHGELPVTGSGLDFLFANEAIVAHYSPQGLVWGACCGVTTGSIVGHYGVIIRSNWGCNAAAPGNVAAGRLGCRPCRHGHSQGMRGFLRRGSNHRLLALRLGDCCRYIWRSCYDQGFNRLFALRLHDRQRHALKSCNNRSFNHLIFIEAS